MTERRRRRTTAEPAKLPAVRRSLSTSVAVAATEPPIGYIDYDEAVVLGRALVSSIESGNWRLGELAHRVEPKYGDRTLERFGGEIGIAGCTLERRRSVFRAYIGMNPAPGPESNYSALRELAKHPDRFAIVAKKPSITKKEAMEIMRGWREQIGFVVDDVDDDDDESCAVPAPIAEVPKERALKEPGQVIHIAQKIAGLARYLRKYRGPLDDGTIQFLRDAEQVVTEVRADFEGRLTAETEQLADREREAA